MYDIVLWGATGHTGRPAARYLQARYAREGKIRFAIAGRNRTRLEALRAEINAPDLDILIVPGGDKEAAERVAPQYARGVLHRCAGGLVRKRNGRCLCASWYRLLRPER